MRLLKKGPSMKTFLCWARPAIFPVLLAAISLFGARASGQTSSPIIPVVTVQATQPFATTTNPGVFTFFRAGSTDATLNVWYDLDGTASNGVDYALIPPHLVTIAGGAVSNALIITPLTNP